MFNKQGDRLDQNLSRSSETSVDREKTQQNRQRASLLEGGRARPGEAFAHRQLHIQVEPFCRLCTFLGQHRHGDIRVEKTPRIIRLNKQSVFSGREIRGQNGVCNK